MRCSRDCFRSGSRRHVRTNQTHQMRGPHSGRKTLPADVTQREDHCAVCFLNREKVTRQVTHGENLAGYFEVAVRDVTWGAQTAMDLRGLEDFGAEFGVILLQGGEFQFQVPPACAG